MSWHYLQAGGAVFSLQDYLAGLRCARAKSNRTKGVCSKPDKLTAASTHFQYGTTLGHSTGRLGVGLLTSSQAASLVKMYQRPDGGLASPRGIAAAYGRNISALLRRFDLSTSSPKTARCWLLEDWISYYGILPDWGMTAGGVLWELVTSVGFTNAPECGWLPTPMAQTRGLLHKPGSHLTLMQWLAGWQRKGYIGQDPAEIFKPTGLIGIPNPQWVEWLMGWPMGWTGLKPLATGRFHKWLRRHSYS